MSNTEIAEWLVNLPKTIDHHVSAILAWVQVHSRLEAASAAHLKNLP